MVPAQREPVTAVGYHYTSWRNWLSIQEHGGIEPYTIDNLELRQYFDYPPLGIWVWEKELKPVSELGSVIYQLATKSQTKVVKLEVQYNDDDVLCVDDYGEKRRVRLWHTGEIGKWQYHPDRPEALVVTAAIKPENIKLLKTFDLMDVVKE